MSAGSAGRSRGWFNRGWRSSPATRVRLRATDNSQDASPALLLKGNRAAHHPSSVVTAPLAMREHMQISLEGTGETIILGRLVEGTGSVNRYRIEPDADPA